jgi:agmatinase
MMNRKHSPLGDVDVHWNTFLDTSPNEATLSDSGVIVIPVPYDSTTSYKTGSRYGPSAIIQASRHLEDYDLELNTDISSIGIYTTPEISPDLSSPKALIQQVRRAIISSLSSEQLLVLLGGEHSISIGAVQAMTEIHSDLSVLYLDAHSDLRDDYMGTQWGHASTARRIYDLCPMVQVGVRSLSEKEYKFIEEVDLPVYFWNGDPPNITQLAKKILPKLSKNVYISIDLDVFDVSLMSAVGTPEPGGITWIESLSLLKAIASERQIVGFDVTELSPLEGPESCAFTAAKLAYKLIGYSTL